uniref:Chitinase-like protein EN03 n=1 Tax=Melanaphis sacchari TaxID=742174 RepID=A0A2H8TTB1_9HEMI
MFFNVAERKYFIANFYIYVEKIKFPMVCYNVHIVLNFCRRVPDASKNLGTYAFRLPKDDVKGIWISFEEPETAKQKATYVKQNNLGGIALMDLSLDDARGLCDANRYPILKAVKNIL